MQKLEDFWTYKDWEVLQRKDRPRFGPLIKVQDAFSDTTRKSPVRSEDSVSRHSSNVVNQSKLSHTSTNSKQKILSKTTTLDQNNNEFDVSAYNPGWYNIHKICRQFEEENEIDCEIGCCIPDAEFEHHIKAKFPADKKPQQLEYISIPQLLIPSRKQASSLHEFMPQSDITSVIDKDIADIAAELMKGENTPMEIVNKLATQERPKYLPSKTRTMRLEDCRDITVNVIENHNSFLVHRPVTNTKTPCHTPSLPVQCSNTFYRIPISTKALLQRSINKLDFLSTKQRSNPEIPLFRCKSECEINHTNFWDTKGNCFVNLPSFQYQPKSSSSSAHVTQPNVAVLHGKRKATDCDHQQAPKRVKQSTSPKQRVLKKQSKVYVSQADLFAAPLYIPSRQGTPRR